MTDLHAEEAGFLADILANPDEDAVRLIYADWLDDHGQSERAEFIRVQCELARRSPEPALPSNRAELDALRRREAKLLSVRNVWDWFGEGLAPPWVGTPAVSISYNVCEVGYFDGRGRPHWKLEVRRGFVEQIQLIAEDWIANADRLTAAHPIREVCLTTVPGWPWTAATLGHEPPYVGVPVMLSLLARRALARRWPRLTFTMPNH